MVFCFTFITYNGQRIFRLDKYQKIGERLQWVVKYQRPLTIVSLLAGLVGLTCLIFINPICWLLLIPMGFLSLFYVVPIPFLKKGLRDIPYLKVFIIALVWSLIIIGLPFIESYGIYAFSTISLYPFTQCFVFILAITLPFDIRDLQFDQQDKLKTIPQALGITITIVIYQFLLILSLVIYYLLEINSIEFVALVIAHIITSIIIALTNKNRKELFYAGWIESTTIILWASVFLAHHFYSL